VPRTAAIRVDRIVRRLRISPTRSPTTDLLVVLLAGIGLGVGIAALVVGHGSATQPAAHSAPPESARASATRPGPASAGAQAGREPYPGYGESTGPAQPKPAAPAHAPPALDAGASASFARLAAGLPGPVELTVAPLGSGRPATLGGDAAAHGWSTTKVPVLTALLEATEENLTSEERSWAESAITESNNESILALFHDLEQIEGGLIGASSYVQELFRESGDEETVVATAPPPPGAVTTFGQTEWRPSNAVKFFSALARGCLLSRQGTNYVLSLMRHIEPSESWGLGSAGFASVAFKGGWGPEPTGAYLVRQSGIIDVGSSRAVAVAIVAFPPAGAGSFETGTAMLTTTATWLREHLRLVPRRHVPCA
jgi:hypothetical protein